MDRMQEVLGQQCISSTCDVTNSQYQCKHILRFYQRSAHASSPGTPTLPCIAVAATPVPLGEHRVDLSAVAVRQGQGEQPLVVRHVASVARANDYGRHLLKEPQPFSAKVACSHVLLCVLCSHTRKCQSCLCQASPGALTASEVSSQQRSQLVHYMAQMCAVRKGQVT